MGDAPKKLNPNSAAFVPSFIPPQVYSQNPNQFQQYQQPQQQYQPYYPPQQGGDYYQAYQKPQFNQQQSYQQPQQYQQQQRPQFNQQSQQPQQTYQQPQQVQNPVRPQAQQPQTQPQFQIQPRPQTTTPSSSPSPRPSSSPVATAAATAPAPAKTSSPAPAASKSQTESKPKEKQAEKPKEQPKEKEKEKEKEQPKEQPKEKEKEKEKEKKPAAESPAPEDELPEINLEHEMAKLEIEMGGQKEHLNVLFMGHVDAGKSTTGGQILFLTGMVDKRTLEKYEKEAKEKGRESWYFSWALDTNPEERDKGKTVEVGKAVFETLVKRYTILDAPGHKSYVPNMIGGAAQADVAILIISARKGEFEAGFDKQGQTREHAMLAKTAGVKKLIVAINKMDDPTVNWSEERYNEIAEKLKPYLKGLGFNLKTDTEFMPISGFTGLNLKDPLDKSICPWYNGTSLLDYLDKMEKIQRNDTAPLRMPVTDKFKDMGTIVGGKIESGTIKMNQTILIMPNQTKAEVIGIEVDDEPTSFGRCGDNVLLKLRGVEEEEVSTGFVVCHPSSPVKTTKIFDAQLVIIDFKNIICAGYTAVMHVHTLVEEVQISEIKHLVDKKSGKKSKQPPKFVKQGHVCIVRLEAAGMICIETYNDYPQLGRFTIRDEGKTIAMGKVLKLIQD